jgi:hypothetical protein
VSAPPPGYPPGPQPGPNPGQQSGPPSGPIPIGPPSGPIPVGPHTGPHTGPQPAVTPPTGHRGGPHLSPHTGPQPGLPLGSQAGPPQPGRPGYYAAPLRQVPQPGLRPRRPGARWTGGLLGGLAFLIATGGAVFGTFQPIQSVRRERAPASGDETEVATTEVTWWEVTRSSGAEVEHYPSYGLLPIVAAGILLIAAVLAFTAFANRKPGAVTGTRVVAALGVGLLAGTVATLLMGALQGLAQANDAELSPGESVTFRIELGIWVTLGAAVMGLLGLAFTLTRARPPGPVRLEPDTPRMGFRMPYGQPQFPPGPAAPQPQPTSPPVQHGQQSLPQHPIPTAASQPAQQAQPKPSDQQEEERPADLTQPVSSANTGQQPAVPPDEKPPASSSRVEDALQEPDQKRPEGS